MTLVRSFTGNFYIDEARPTFFVTRLEKQPLCELQSKRDCDA
jgi:hypothetical protein